MHRIDGANHNGNMFKETPLPGTKMTAAWANAVQEELVKVITDPTGGNAALAKGNNGQLLAAILTMIGGAVQLTTSEAGVAIVLPKFTIQMGRHRANVFIETTVAKSFPTPFAQMPYVFCQPVIAASSTVRDLWVQTISASITVDGFTAQYQSDDGEDQGIGGFDWIAFAPN